MKKSLLFILLIASSLSAMTQTEPMQHLPAGANVIAVFRGHKFLQQASLRQLDSLGIVRHFFAEFMKTGSPLTGLEETGVDFDANACYFNQSGDSIGYNGLIVPLKNEQLFTKALRQHPHRKITQTDGFRQLTATDKKTVLLWNREFAILLIGTPVGSFWQDSAKSKLYGLSYPAYHYSNSIKDEAVRDTAAVEVVDSAAVMADADSPTIIIAPPVPDPQGIPGDQAAAASVQPADKSSKILIGPDTSVVNAILSPEEQLEALHAVSYGEYKRRLDRFTAGRDSIIGSWTAGAALALAKQHSTPAALLQVLSRYADKQSAISLWVKDLGRLYSNFGPSAMENRLLHQFSAYGSSVVNVYFDRHAIRIRQQQLLPGTRADHDAMDRIFRQRLNKNILRYVDADKTIGLFSVAFNTEAYLRMIPRAITTTLGYYGSLGKTSPEDVGMISDLFALLLDEKAVGNVINGDGLLAFTGFRKQRVSYLSYDYDEKSFQNKQVTKTKDEVLPGLLVMASTSDPAFIRKVLDFAVRKKTLRKKNGIYARYSENSPGYFDFNFLLKDNILFFSNDYEQLRQLQANKPARHLPAKERQLLLKNNMALFFDPGQLLRQVPRSEFPNAADYQKFSQLMQKIGPVSFISPGIRKGVLTMEFKAETAANTPNGLQYLLQLIEAVSQLSNQR